MASFHRDSANPKAFRAQVVVRGVTRKLWLGKCTKTQAKKFCEHLEALVSAAELGLEPGPATLEWKENVGPRIRKNLEKWGLIENLSTFRTTIEGFCEDYISSRKDWKPKTRERMNVVKSHICTQLGANSLISSITEGDAKRFSQWCRGNHKDSHAGKTISSARQFFAAAVDERIISRNPFDRINASQKHDKSREFYISQELADRIIKKSPPYTAALIATARYAGLRCPSEYLTLEWQNIDWEDSRAIVHSPKLENHEPRRTIPIFPKWLPHLEYLWDATPEDAQYVFTIARASAARRNRVLLLNVLHKLNIEPWPKLWQNLRASCETDLKEQFPGQEHVVHYWMGNSPAVSAKHYDRIHEEHYAKAVCDPG